MSTETPSPVDAGPDLLPPELVQGTYDTLPCGVRVRDDDPERARTFILHEHETRDVSVLEDRKARRVPSEWTMRLVSIGVESIGDVPVYAPFAESGYQKVPDVVKRLTVADAEFLVLAANMYSYGKTSKISTVCPACDHRMRDVPFDLERITPYAFPEGSHDPVLTVVLERPVKFSHPTFPALKERAWDRFTVRAPELRDLRIVDKDTSPGWEHRVLARCVLSIEDAKGGRMPQDVMKALGDDVILRLPARHTGTISRTMMRTLPHLDREVILTCSQCGYEVREGVDPTTLLPGG